MTPSQNDDNAPAALARGARLGPYQIEGLLGRGGMGEVYRARDTRLDRLVAIKVARTNFTERFEREARAIAALNHPYICRLYDIGPNYLVMEYLEGETLRRPVSLDLALRYGEQICEALGVAHSQGIIHRDLKPVNIMVTKSGIKILDFGLAKLLPIGSGEEMKTVASSITQSGIIVGTPAYMAPEQIEGGDADPRTDIFALGCILYELLSGQSPFRGKTAQSVFAAILKDQPLPLRDHTPQMPSSVERIVKRCLAKDPDQRWQNAYDVKHAIEDVKQEPFGVQASTRKSRWATVVALVAILTIALISASTYFLRSPVRQLQTLRLRIAPPTGVEFLRAPNRGGMALSPDGQLLAFTGSRDGQLRLWIQPLNSSTARELPGTDRAHLPFWSPDSRSVAFFADGKLKRIDADGGRLQTLADATVPQGGTWSSGGIILFSPTYESIYRIDAAGGSPVPVTMLDRTMQETERVAPQFLDDGKQFLYWTFSQRADVTGVYLSSIDDPARKIRVVAAESWVIPAKTEPDGSDYLLWARGDTVVGQRWNPKTGQLLAEPQPLGGPVGRLSDTPELSVSRTGLLVYGSPVELQLTWVDRNGVAAGTVGEPGFLGSPRLSPDGRMVAFSRTVPERGVFILDLSRGTSSRIAPRNADKIVWSPNGTEVAFSAPGERWTNVMLRKADGSGTGRSLAPSDANQEIIDWLPDGKSLVYYESDPDKQQRELRNAMHESTAAPRVLRSSSHREPEADLSPDGKWFAYASDEGGAMEVFVQPFIAESPQRERRWQVSSRGGSFPRWRYDGRELFYISSNGELMSVDVKSGSDNLELGSPRPLFSLPAVFNGSYSYDVAPDGQRFLVVAGSSRRGREPLSVIVNWPAALGK